jgi:hypothetical protein
MSSTTSSKHSISFDGYQPATALVALARLLGRRAAQEAGVGARYGDPERATNACANAGELPSSVRLI